MKTPTLEYYLHDEWDAFRFELAGSLSGDGAESVYQAWRTALSIVGDRPVIFDISFVGEADERGRALLQLWHQNGARIIAAPPESRALAKLILGEALPAPPAKQSWLQRLNALIRRRFIGSAVISTEADNRHSFSASARHKSGVFTAVSDSGRSECRVP
jgi:hypothetical protein